MASPSATDTSSTRGTIVRPLWATPLWATPLWAASMLRCYFDYHILLCHILYYHIFLHFSWVFWYNYFKILSNNNNGDNRNTVWVGQALSANHVGGVRVKVTADLSHAGQYPLLRGILQMCVPLASCYATHIQEEPTYVYGLLKSYFAYSFFRKVLLKTRVISARFKKKFTIKTYGVRLTPNKCIDFYIRS